MLFHKDIWVPAELKKQVAPIFGLEYSLHALSEAKRDRNKEIVNFPKHFLPRVATVIEYEDDGNGKLIKIVARQPYDKDYDLVMAISLITRRVKTVWLNNKNDLHFTLIKSKYASAPLPKFNPIPSDAFNGLIFNHV